MSQTIEVEAPRFSVGQKVYVYIQEDREENGYATVKGIYNPFLYVGKSGIEISNYEYYFEEGKYSEDYGLKEHYLFESEKEVKTMIERDNLYKQDRKNEKVLQSLELLHN